MRLALIVTPNAERQIRVAAKWWRRNRAAAPALFADEVARGFELITSQPGAGEMAPDVDLKGVRRVYLSRVGYYLYYRLSEPEVVRVVAIWHSSRGESPPV